MDAVRIFRTPFRRALILENPSTLLDTLLLEQGIEPDRLPEEATLDRAAVIARLRERQHDLIFKRSRFEIDDEVLSASANLAAIMLCCIGDDSVDKEACARHGVMVTNDPVSNARSVVELVFGEMICMARRIFHAVEATRASEWTKDSRARYELKGKTLSIIGLGNIGKAVAQMAEDFDMHVCFYDKRPVAQEVGTTLGWEKCDTLDAAFQKGDFVTVHVSAEDPAGNSNRGMITYEHFKQLGEERGPNSPRIFLNAARGFLYEPEDLNRAAREGFVKAAAIDVFPEEPGSKSDAWQNPYAESPGIVSTPHIGAATQEAQPRIAQHVAMTTRLMSRFGTLRNCVFSPGQTIGVQGAEPKYILGVVHSDQRGTKKAVADAIYDAGINSIESAHRDFPKYGIAYDITAIDRPLTDEQLQRLVESARDISGDVSAVRSIRQIQVAGSADG